MFKQRTSFRRITSVFAVAFMMFVMAASCVPSQACSPSVDFSRGSLAYLVLGEYNHSSDGQPAAVRRVEVNSVFALLGQKTRNRIYTASAYLQYIAVASYHENSFFDGFSISEEPVRRDLSSGIAIKTKHKLE